MKTIIYTMKRAAFYLSICCLFWFFWLTFWQTAPIHQRLLDNDLSANLWWIDLYLSGYNNTPTITFSSSWATINPDSYLESVTSIPYYQYATYTYWQSPSWFCLSNSSSQWDWYLRHTFITNGSWPSNFYWQFSPYAFSYISSANSRVDVSYVGVYSYANCIAYYSWYSQIFVVWVQNNNTFQVYVNNVLKNTYSLKTSINLTWHTLQLWKAWFVDQTNWSLYTETGTIQDLRIYNFAFTTWEVDYLYTLWPAWSATPTPTCWTDIIDTCPGGFRTSLYEVIDNTAYWLCHDADQWLEEALQCQLDIDVADAVCWTINKQYFWSWNIPGIVTWGDNYCMPNNDFLSGSVTYSSTDKQRYWFCEAPSDSTKLLRCDAKSLEYTTPVCWVRNNDIISTGNFTRSSPSSVFCEYWEVFYTWDVFENVLFNWEYTRLQKSWNRGCYIPAENQIAYCQTLVKDWPSDPDRIWFDENLYNNPNFQDESKLRSYINQFLNRTKLWSFFNYLFSFFIPWEVSSIPIYFPKINSDWTNLDITYEQQNIQYSDRTEYMTNNCNASWCVFSLTNWDVTITSQSSNVMNLFSWLLWFLHVVVIVAIIFSLIFWPFLWLFNYLKQPLLFLSMRHIDDSQNNLIGNSITLITYIIIGAFLLTLIVAIWSFLTPFFQLIVSISYNIHYWLLTILWWNPVLFNNWILFFIWTIFLVTMALIVRFVSKSLPIPF